MPVAPEEVRNVWAGDAVWFDGPVGNVRRPSVWWYVALIAAAVLTAVMWYLPGGPVQSGMNIVPLYLVVVALVIIGAEVGAGINRWLARRIARRRVVYNLRQLAVLCWMRPLIRGRAVQRFDAEEWIRRTGPNGPRLLLREFTLAPIAADPSVAEEEPIETFIERDRGQRVSLWINLGFVIGLSIFLLSLSGSTRSAITWFLPVYGVGVVLMLARLGFRPLGIATLTAAPGRLSRLTPGGPLVFTREDSILILEPMGTARGVFIHAVRRDGRTTGFRLSLGAEDPMLARLLSRWCWREGAGQRHEESPMRSKDLIGSS